MESSLSITPQELIQLHRLLIVYKEANKTCRDLIYFLTREIELLKTKYPGHTIIEKLIETYNYPRNFDQEEINEAFDVESFNLLCM